MTDNFFDTLTPEEAGELSREVEAAKQGILTRRAAANQEKLKAEFLAELKEAQAKGYRGQPIKEIKAKFMRRGLDFGKIDFTV